MAGGSPFVRDIGADVRTSMAELGERDVVTALGKKHTTDMAHHYSDCL